MGIKYLMCVAGGIAIGFYVAKDRLEQQYFARLQEETEEARDFYRRKYEKQVEALLNNEESMVESAVEAMATYQSVDLVPSMMTQELAQVIKKEAEAEAVQTEEPFDSIEDAAIIDTDGRTSLVSETPKEPVAYHEISTPRASEQNSKDDDPIKIITSEDFVKNETGYAQYSITYFSDDDILAGESDQVLKLEARNATMSEDVLLQLKAGPEAMGGESFIYTQNHSDRAEFEIEWKKGAYADLVGFHPNDRTG